MTISIVNTGIIPGSTFVAVKSVSMDLGTGPNRALMVLGFVDTSTTVTVDSAKAGGVAMTAGALAYHNAGTSNAFRAFYLAGASLPTGVQSVELTVSSNARKPGAYIVLLQGDTGALSFGAESITGNLSANITPSLTVASAAGDFAIALMRTDATADGTGTGGTTCSARVAATSYFVENWIKAGAAGTTTLNATFATPAPFHDGVGIAVTESAGASDTTLPTQTGTVAVGTVTSSSIQITWPAGADNVAVTSYETSPDGTTWTDRGNVLAYTFTGLTASTSYTFQVRAKDAAANTSTPALSVTQSTSAAASSDRGATHSRPITGLNIAKFGLRR